MVCSDLKVMINHATDNCYGLCRHKAVDSEDFRALSHLEPFEVTLVMLMMVCSDLKPMWASEVSNKPQ